MQYGFKLDPGEQITHVIHRHPLSFLPTLLTSTFLVIAAGFFAYIAGAAPEYVPYQQPLALALAAVIGILAALIFAVGFYVFRSNALVFTNLHLIHVQQLALFQRRVSQLSFLRVEDVTGRRAGFLQSVFNYGTVEVQSAGETEKFIFDYAPHPQDVADQALEIHEHCMRQAGPSAGD